MFKQRSNMSIVNVRVIHTRAHDALLFNTERPQSEKYKNNVLYKGPTIWNSLSANTRNILDYECLKSLLYANAIANTVPIIR